MKHIRLSHKPIWGGLLLAGLLLTACKQNTQEQGSDVAHYTATETTNGTGSDVAHYVTTKYAEGFKVKNTEGGVRLVDIQNPQADERTDQDRQNRQDRYRRQL